MSEQAKFQEWWESTGTNSVILRAQAWSAWQAAITTIEQTAPDPHIALMEAEHDDRMPQPEDPDEWIEITDPDHVLRSCDFFQIKDQSWHRIASSVGKTVAGCRYFAEAFRCRRSDLPKVEQVEQAEQCAACDAPAEPGTAGCKDCNEYATAICSPEPEQWPKYYTTIDSPSSDVAFVKRVDETSYSVVYKNGRECPGFLWSAKNQSRRKQLTEDEAMALLKPTSNADWSYHETQKPQPQKTMLRLWIDSDCNIHAGLKGDRDLQLFYDHETRQFYTEEPC